MSLINKYARAIRDGIGNFAHAVRERWPVLTVTILGVCVPTYAMAWIFDFSDNFVDSIAITVLATSLPVLKLMSPPEPFSFWALEVWIALFCWLTLAMVVGSRYDWPFVSNNAVALILALPFVWIVVELVRREMILIAGFAPALIATMIYWISGLVDNNVGFDFSLLPLPVIFFGGAIWAPVALLILKFARQHKNGRISGPGTQMLAMTMMFYPVTLVAITLPTGVGLSAIWSNLSLALIGILLSAVISEPLRRFLIEWGRLAPFKR